MSATMEEPLSTIKAGMKGWYGQVGQLGAVGVIATLLLVVVTSVTCGGGYAVYSLISLQLQRAHEDRVAERSADRDERRYEREQFAAEARSVRDILSRVTNTLDAINRTQTEQAQRLAELARILERIKTSMPPDEPQGCAPLPARILARLALHVTLFAYPPPDTVEPAKPSKADVVVPSTPVPVPLPSPDAPKVATDRLQIPVGRFAWLYLRRDIPVTYHVDGETIAKLDLPAGTPYAGIKFDDPPQARPRTHITPADAQGQACALLGTATGTTQVYVWANVGEGKPPELLQSITIEVIQPRPPPEPVAPVKPDPVKPVPVNPPADGVTAKLRPIYLTLPAAERKSLATMAAVGMDWAAAATEDPRYADVGALEAAVLATQKTLVDVTKLKPFSAAIGAELLAVLPNNDATTKLTPELRAKLKAVYASVASAYRTLAAE
jgi:hypothetical protein